jgi:hypothetical protein
MQTLDRQIILDALEDEDALCENYSGRFMYGDKCFGIVGSIQDYGKFMSNLGMNVYDDSIMGLTVFEVDSLAGATREDSMGRDAIFYFPGYNVEPAEDDEDE